jgi:glycosyltransferase involved in cell wall biosynthesis
MTTQSVILTIFNKASILKMIISALFEYTSESVNEYIFVLDGCTDNSESILHEMLPAIPHKALHKIIKTNDVFELRANNAGLRECTNKYAIIVQDDMCIQEKGWNDRLLQPILLYKDIWAVTARTSCSLHPDGYWYNLNEGPVGYKYKDNINYPRNHIFVGQVVNRGPLLVTMSIMKEIGYFDETLPGCIGCDDVDACLKVFQKFGLRCCSFWIGYDSPLEWGATRTGPNGDFVRKEEARNMKEVLARYSNLLNEWKYDEIRLSDSV